MHLGTVESWAFLQYPEYKIGEDGLDLEDVKHVTFWKKNDKKTLDWWFPECWQGGCCESCVLWRSEKCVATCRNQHRKKLDFGDRVDRVWWFWMLKILSWGFFSVDLSALCQGFHAAERACAKDVCPESISVAWHITCGRTLVSTIRFGQSHMQAYHLNIIHDSLLLCIQVHPYVHYLSKPSSKRCISSKSTSLLQFASGLAFYGLDQPEWKPKDRHRHFSYQWLRVKQFQRILASPHRRAELMREASVDMPPAPRCAHQWGVIVGHQSYQDSFWMDPLWSRIPCWCGKMLIMWFLCWVLRCFHMAYAGKLSAFPGCEGSMHRPA